VRQEGGAFTRGRRRREEPLPDVGKSLKIRHPANENHLPSGRLPDAGTPEEEEEEEEEEKEEGEE
jgi:hypothetical protein